MSDDLRDEERVQEKKRVPSPESWRLIGRWSGIMLWGITDVWWEVVGLIEWLETGVAAKEEASSVLLDASEGRLGWWWLLLVVLLPLVLT